MKKVKRWEWTHDGMWDNDANDGEYVLCSDYEKLQKENAALNEIKRTLIRRVELLEVQNSKITKLTHQLETLKKCAEFYADPENYILRNIQEGEWTTIMPASDKEIIRNYKHPETDWVGTINVCGKTARKALQDVEESEID